MGHAIHRQSLFGCELVLSLKSSTVIHNALRHPPLTSMKPVTSCKYTDEEQTGRWKVLTEISSLIQKKDEEQKIRLTHSLHKKGWNSYRFNTNYFLVDVNMASPGSVLHPCNPHISWYYRLDAVLLLFIFIALSPKSTLISNLKKMVFWCIGCSQINSKCV